eukprot:43302-Chlamydomonas_euryale.AAC.6
MVVHQEAAHEVDQRRLVGQQAPHGIVELRDHQAGREQQLFRDGRALLTPHVQVVVRGGRVSRRADLKVGGDHEPHDDDGACHDKVGHQHDDLDHELERRAARHAVVQEQVGRHRVVKRPRGGDDQVGVALERRVKHKVRRGVALGVADKLPQADAYGAQVEHPHEQQGQRVHHLAKLGHVFRLERPRYCLEALPARHLVLPHRRDLSILVAGRKLCVAACPLAHRARRRHRAAATSGRHEASRHSRLHPALRRVLGAAQKARAWRALNRRLAPHAHRVGILLLLWRRRLRRRRIGGRLPRRHARPQTAHHRRRGAAALRRRRRRLRRR